VFQNKYLSRSKKEFHRWDTPYRCKSGIFVRSKGEQEIANFLFEQKIHFDYEPKLKMGSKVIHPDFYLKDKDIYIEFFGMNTPRYRISTWWKKREYRKNGLKLIPLSFKSQGSLGAVIKFAYEKLKQEKFPQTKYFDWSIRNRASNFQHY